MTYDNDIQRILDLLFYQDRSKDTISSQDEDVLRIFSGDEKAAKTGIETFMDRHREACWVVEDGGPNIVVKVSGLFDDPEQHTIHEKYIRKQKRFREKRWPEPRPAKKGEKR